MNRLTRWTLLALLLAVPFLALAQDVPPAADLDVLALFKVLVGAIQGGQWPLVVVVVFIGLVQLLRRFGAKWVPWLATSDGGTVLTFLTVMGSALAAGAFLPGAVITWPFIGKAALAALAAIGGWTGTRRFLGVLAPLAAKIPSIGPWLSGVLLWLSGTSVAAQVEVKASGNYVAVPAGMTPQQAAELLASAPAKG